MTFFIHHKWMVFVAAFSVAFFDYGIASSLGGLYIAMLDTFNAGRAETAFVQSLLITFCWGFGLISGILLSRLGIKIVTFSAAVLTGAGFILSYFSTSIYHLYVLISVVVGVGSSTMYLEAVLSVERSFFGKQKSIAVSLQCVGTAISGFVWPRLVTLSLESYSLRGTFLILGGVLLNNIAFAIVFTETDQKLKKDERTEEQCYTNATSDDITEMSEITPESEMSNNKHCIANGCELTADKSDESFRYPDEDVMDNKGHMFAREQDDIDNCKTDLKGVDTVFNNDNTDKLDCNKSTKSSCSRISRAKGESKQDAAYQIANECSDNIKMGYPGTIISWFKNENRCINNQLCVYLTYTLACILHLSAITGFLILYQDINVFNGLSIAQSDITYMVYSLFNISSRFLPVIPAQIPNLNIFIVPILSSLCAAFGQMIPLCASPSMATSTITMAFCGIADGGWISSMQVILFEILPVDKQTVGFGFVLTAFSVASAATGPLFGLSRDESTSYQTVLIITTAMFGVSALLGCVCLVKSTRLGNKT